jgi:hypothetical protein
MLDASNPLASRSVDRCSMTRAARPTAAGGCLTDRTITPALPMPYTGGRVGSASRTSSPDEGRDARHAKWHLRSSVSSDGIRKEMTRKGRSGDRDWTRGNIFCHARLKARFNHVCTNSFHWNDCYTQLIHQLPDEHYIASAAKRSKPSPALDRRTPQQVIRDPTR